MPGVSFQVLQALSGGASPPSISYVTSSSTSSAGDPQTFSGVSLGTATAGKRIIVGWSSYVPSGTPQLDSATIDGNAATIACQVLGTNIMCGIIIANVGDSATSGDIVLNWSTSQQYTAISVWKVSGLTTTTAHATGTDTGTPASLTLNVPASGICAAFAATIDGSPTAPSSWVGLTSSGTQAVGAATNNAFAADFFAAAQTPLTVSVTVPGSRSVLAAASYGN